MSVGMSGELYQRLLSVFSSEAAERIQRVNHDLMALERGADGEERAESLTEIMRELHTLKGAGGSVNLEPVELLSHQLESLFAPVQTGERSLSPALVDVAYRGLDAIQAVVEAAVQGRDHGIPVEDLLSAMRASVDAPAPMAPPAIGETAIQVPPPSLGNGDGKVERGPVAGRDTPPHTPSADQAISELIDRLESIPEVDAGPRHDALAAGLEEEEAGRGDLNVQARRRVLSIFASESVDRVERINRQLIELEQGEGPAEPRRSFSQIMRELHTLKGSGAAVHVEDIERISHHLESLIEPHAGTQRLSSAVAEAAYRGLDAIQSIAEAILAEREHRVDVTACVEALEAAAAAGAPRWTAAAPRVEAPVVRPPVAERPHAPTTAPAPTASGETKEPSEAPTAGANEERAARQGPAPSPMPGAGAGNETIRVATSKLEALMGNVGELLVTRIGTEQRISDARELTSALWEVDAVWREVQARIKALQTTVGPVASEAEGADDLLDLAASVADGELLLGEARRRFADLLRNLEGDGRRLAQVTNDLQDDVRNARMLPVATVFDAFPRTIRDLSVELGKRVRLVVEGADTEVDRTVIDQIRGPLTHLLRNAIDHGIESPELRSQGGKAVEATIRLSASHQGDSLVIEVEDDGRGIDPGQVRTLAVHGGVLSEEAAEVTSDHEALRLIFRPGFSTSSTVTDLSGRGVGLDAVRDAVERLRGSVDVDSVIGQGTRFTLRLPLSVATTLCLLVRIGEERFALPIANVSRILRVARAEVERAEGRDVFRLDSEPVAVSRLGDAIGAVRPEADGAASDHAVVLGSGERRIVFTVDDVLGTQTLVMKSLPTPLKRVRHVSGAAILGTGEVIGILNAADLVRRDEILAAAVRSRTGAGEATARTQTLGRVILVVDDSIVTRTMEKGVLESAGYEVLAAVDGMEAWEILRSTRCDLVVSDVNMPRMSGFDLTSKVRSDHRLRDLPIVLVTSLDSEEDQAKGVEVGADAYLVKGPSTQERLLETVQRLI
jgi:two-component system chemotaxis sensor kinase CheA